MNHRFALDDNSGGISYADSASLDAFSRVRVSQAQTMFECLCAYNTDSLRMESGVTGDGVAPTHSANSRMVALTIAAGANGGTSWMQSYQYIPYQPGKCVGQDELIILASGDRIRAIDLVGKSFEVKTVVGGKIRKVSAFADINAFEPVYRITTQTGRVIIRNSEHPMWSGRKLYSATYKPGMLPSIGQVGFRKISDISVGDVLCVAETSPYEGAGEMDKDDLSMLAFMIGDGGVTQQSVNFTQMPGAQLDEFLRIAGRLGTRARCSGKYRYNLSKSSGVRTRGSGKCGVVRLLQDHGVHGCHSRDKRVPSAVFRLDNHHVAHFLNRLFSTDGWAYSNKATGKIEIGFCSISEGLVRDVQHLLARLSIRGVISRRQSVHAWNLSISHAASVTMFSERVGILGKERAVASAAELASKKHRPQDAYLRKSIPSGGFCWDVVVSVEELPPQWTVAICVPGPETFITDFYEHNSQLIAITGVMGAAAAGVGKQYGYADEFNGILYEQNGLAGLQFNRRTSTSGVVVDNVVPQAAWNIDRFDGTGPSGITIDVTKAFILIIDLQFLGMGRVRVGFDIDGVLYYAHQFLNANVLAVPYMQTASLPILAIISAAAGLAAPATMYFKCAQVASEAGFDPTASGRDFSVEGTVAAATTGRKHVLSIRPKTQFNAITNRGYFDLHEVVALAGSNAIIIEVCIGVVFTAPLVFADVNSTYSFMEYNVNGVYSSLVGGVVIATLYVGTGGGAARSAGSGNVSIAYPITLNRAGANRALGTLSVLVTSIGGASDTRAAFNWHEIR